jgi:hypothetical protein
MKKYVVCAKCKVPLGAPGTTPTNKIAPDTYLHIKCPNKATIRFLRKAYNTDEEGVQHERIPITR